MTHLLHRFTTLVVATFFAALLFIGCDYEDETIDTTVLPAETTTGANTFGCLIDGWIYVGGRYKYEIRSSIDFQYVSDTKTMLAEVEVEPSIILGFTISEPEQGEKLTFTDAHWGGELLPDGMVTITRFDIYNRVISGQFEGGRIAHGRFDVLFRIVDPIPEPEPVDY